MIDRTAARGGWAVGSGNSIPNYVPLENYYAMIQTALREG
jgi:uroporphyrinogen decarboxylase